MDLTAARSSEELVDLFIADAALLSSTWAQLPPSSLVDIGSGAGAPGIGVALLAPEIALTLVEPKAKRVAFLRSTLGALDRADIRLERKRAEELPDSGWEVALSRATLGPRAWLRVGARIARGRVWVLLAEGEVPELDGLRIVEDRRYVWPLTGSKRRAVAYEVVGSAGRDDSGGPSPALKIR